MAKSKKLSVAPKRTHPVPLANYHEAVQQHFGWAPSEYEMVEYYANGPALVRHGEAVYQVDSGYDLNQQARAYLGEQAVDFHPAWAPDVMEEVHYKTDFYQALLGGIAHDALQLAQLQTAMAISKITVDDPIFAFWVSLQHLSPNELYPLAIEAATETYDLESMVTDVEVFLCGEGSTYLTEMADGFFESVQISEPTDEQAASDGWAYAHLFYIYSKDPMAWEESPLA